MARFILSAFADEASVDFDGQLAALAEEGISLIELRGVDGKSCADLTDAELKTVRAKLDDAGVRLSALGSPFGKAQLAEPFDAHLNAYRRGLEICDALACERMRMFSFYPPKGGDPDASWGEVQRRLSVMLAYAEDAGVTLVHENEKGIFGDVTARCETLMQAFAPRMGFVFDPANFVQCGVNTLEAFERLRPYVTYMHLKDAFLSDGAVVRVGRGDGHVEEIVRMLSRECDGDMVLTVEPHLTVFEGLTALQNEGLTHRERYPSARAAFHAACEAVREMLANV